MSQLNFMKNNSKVSTNSKVELQRNGRYLPPIIKEAFENYMGVFKEPQAIYKDGNEGWEKAKRDIISDYFNGFEKWMKEKDFKKKPKVKAGCVKFYGLHGIVACYADLLKEKEESNMLENENNRLLDRLAERNGGNKDIEKEVIDLKEDNEVLQRKINKLKKQLLTTEEKLRRAMESKKIIKQDVAGKHSVVNQERYDEIMSITGNPAEDTSSSSDSEESNISMKTTEIEEEPAPEEPAPSVKEAVNHIKKIAENDAKVVKKTTGTKKTTKKLQKDKKPSEKPKKNTSKSENTTKKNEKTEKKTKKKVDKTTKKTEFSEDKKICSATIENKTYKSQVDLHITEDYAFYQDGMNKYHFVGKVELQKPPEYLQQFENITDYTDDRGYFKNVYNEDIVDFHINITAIGEKKLNDLLKEDGEQTFTDYEKDYVYKNIKWLSHEEQVKHKFKAFDMYPDKNDYIMNLTTNNNRYCEKKDIQDYW